MSDQPRSQGSPCLLPEQRPGVPAEGLWWEAEGWGYQWEGEAQRRGCVSSEVWCSRLYLFRDLFTVMGELMPPFSISIPNLEGADTPKVVSPSYKPELRQGGKAIPAGPTQSGPSSDHVYHPHPPPPQTSPAGPFTSILQEEEGMAGRQVGGDAEVKSPFCLRREQTD